MDLVGFIAAILTTVAFLPQAVKTIQSKNTEGISLVMYVVFTLGTSCWLIYGLQIGNMPMILANAVTTAFSATILVYKLKYR